MNHIKSMASLLMLVLFMSCNNKENGSDQNNGNGAGNGDPKTYTTVAEAATAAKADMLTAMEKGITFGLDKEKVRASTPGEPIQKLTVDFNALLSADSSTSFERIAKDAGTTMVPLVNGGDVVAMIGIQSENNQFKVSMLGESQSTAELDEMAKAGATQGQRIAMMEVPNLSVNIYQIISPERGTMYYTSYNGNSLREPMSATRLLPMLSAAAQEFQKKYGDKLKSKKLVK